MKLLMSLDQGTTSSRCILFNSRAEAVASAFVPFKQIYPADGWVEHDPMELLSSQLQAAEAALAQADAPGDIAAIGLTNQRETVIVWDKSTGKPLYNAIVWQCRRTAEYCDALKREGCAEAIRAKTGLLLDAYFSATKIKWILDNVPGARRLAEGGAALFGTVDSWLVWNLTGGKVHATDAGNAARTMLFNIHTMDWDDDLLRLFGVPRQMLPAVHPSSHIYGRTALFGGQIPIAGVAGDQQAALFGQGCLSPGDIKNTYGTGCFILMNTGGAPASPADGLLATVACGSGGAAYAVEGSVFVAGAAIGWLRDGMGLIRTNEESQTLAESVPSSEGVHFVPAFVGLGAPYWDPYARGAITGLTRAHTRAHIVRAALEAIAFQSAEVIAAMRAGAGLPIRAVKADGGASRNDFLMQFQADILGAEILRPTMTESSAWGAACLAGLAVGAFEGAAAMNRHIAYQTFTPRMSEADAAQAMEGWKAAVARALS